jgi:phosphomevalonate kinase
MLSLNQEALKSIYIDDELALLILEQSFDMAMGSTHTNSELSKSVLVKVREVIEKHKLDSEEGIKTINAEIYTILNITNRKAAVRNATQRAPKDSFVGASSSVRKPRVDAKGYLERIEQNPHLSSIEKEALLRLQDEAFKADKSHLFEGIAQKAERHYFKVASAKLKILQILGI